MPSYRRARGDEAHAPSPRASAACMRSLLSDALSRLC